MEMLLIALNKTTLQCEENLSSNIGFFDFDKTGLDWISLHTLEMKRVAESAKGDRNICMKMDSLLFPRGFLQINY